jgi:hypothetical protein
VLSVVHFNLQTHLARGEFFGGYLHASCLSSKGRNAASG